MFDKTRVLVIEDEEGIRITLEDLLKARGCVVTTCRDGLSGEKAGLSGEFDLILLDLMLPGRDGYSLCKNLRDAGIGTPIMMLTARGTNMDVVVGLRQGADDYLAKPFDPEVLVARMEAVLRRAAASPRGADPTASERAVRFGGFTLDLHKGELSRDSGAGPESIQLNAQEYKLLEFFASNPDRVIKREEVLDEVWGYDSDTTTRTIDVHVAKLRQKLGESDQPRHILTIRGRGYKFVL